MKKILSLLAVCTVGLPCVGLTSAFSMPKTPNIHINVESLALFNPRDFNSWGASQKKAINKIYLQDAHDWYTLDKTWYQFRGDESFAYQDAFSYISPLVNVWSNTIRHISTVSGQPLNPNMNLKQLLAQGLIFSVKGTYTLSGTINVEIKGVI